MREPLLGAAVGKKGVGKTYQTIILLNKYVRGNPANGIVGRKVLILDVNDEFSQYKPIALDQIVTFSASPIPEIRRVRTLHTNGKRMTLNEIADALFYILENYRGGLLLIEDINRYVSDSLPNDLIGAICTQRHMDLDIIMHFQALGRIVPKIWQNLNWLRFHKNSESVHKHRNKFPDKEIIFKLAESIVDEQYESGNQRFFLYVDLDTEKIKGAFDQTIFNRGVNKFISENNNITIKPLLNKRDDKGRLVYDYSSALNYLRKFYLQKFYGNKV